MAVVAPGACRSRAVVRLTEAVSDHAVPANEHHAGKDIRIGLAIDQNSATYWEGWPRADQPHWAVFRPAAAVPVEPGTKFSCRLEFQSAIPKHSLGRFRISITDRDDPPLEGGVAVDLKGFGGLGEAYALVGEPARAAEAFAKALDRATART